MSNIEPVHILRYGTARQKDILAKFKRQINTISLDTLLDYVYNTYPDTAENSLIRDKYIKKESD